MRKTIAVCHGAASTCAQGRGLNFYRSTSKNDFSSLRRERVVEPLRRVMSIHQLDRRTAESRRGADAGAAVSDVVNLNGRLLTGRSAVGELLLRRRHVRRRACSCARAREYPFVSPPNVPYSNRAASSTDRFLPHPVQPSEYFFNMTQQGSQVCSRTGHVSEGVTPLGSRSRTLGILNTYTPSYRTACETSSSMTVPELMTPPTARWVAYVCTSSSTSGQSCVRQLLWRRRRAPAESVTQLQCPPLSESRGSRFDCVRDRSPTAALSRRRGRFFYSSSSLAASRGLHFVLALVPVLAGSSRLGKGWGRSMVSSCFGAVVSPAVTPSHTTIQSYGSRSILSWSAATLLHVRTLPCIDPY